jgi:hypothetical protein
VLDLVRVTSFTSSPHPCSTNIFSTSANSTLVARVGGNMCGASTPLGTYLAAPSIYGSPSVGGASRFVLEVLHGCVRRATSFYGKPSVSNYSSVIIESATRVKEASAHLRWNPLPRGPQLQLGRLRHQRSRHFPSRLCLRCIDSSVDQDQDQYCNGNTVGVNGHRPCRLVDELALDGNRGGDIR